MHSQLDHRTSLRFRLPDEARVIDVLNRPILRTDLSKIRWSERAPIRQLNVISVSPSLLDIYQRSHVLVHGIGSSGKAGLGLKLLLSPVVHATDKTVLARDQSAKVLVVSFLYPEAYFETLKQRILRLFHYEFPELAESSTAETGPVMEVMQFYPGFLNPEDFLWKIENTLEKAELAGEPFTGVLLDGIHNVFLQFPRLQQQHIVWATLYSLLRKRNVTVVTTHTTFSIREDDVDTDRELELKQALPLLHAFVQAADYYLNVVRVIHEGRAEHPVDQARVRDSIDFQIIVRQAISQTPPREPIFWSREKLVAYWDPQQPDLFYSRSAASR